MKTLTFLCFLLAQTWAQAYPLTCKAQCQYYDDFEKLCQFQTTCTYQNNCMTYQFCERWDTFEQKCLSTASRTECHTPNPFIGAPSCTENCQYFDLFENKCLYRTKCEYAANCVTFTKCERWDSFDRKCYSEEKTLQCN